MLMHILFVKDKLSLKIAICTFLVYFNSVFKVSNTALSSTIDG